MKDNEKVTLALITTIIILITTVVVMAASWPHAPADNVVVYRGWSIYLPAENSTSTFVFVATKPGCAPIYGVDLPDLIADIYEAELP